MRNNLTPTDGSPVIDLAAQADEQWRKDSDEPYSQGQPTIHTYGTWTANAWVHQTTHQSRYYSSKHLGESSTKTTHAVTDLETVCQGDGCFRVYQ